MMPETDFSKFAINLKNYEPEKIGLSRLDAALSGPLPRLFRTFESTVKECVRSYKRDPDTIFAVGSLLGLNRKTGLVSLLSSEWEKFSGIAGFCKANLDPNVAVVMSRGCVVLRVEGLYPNDRGRKVFVTDFNSFSLDESIGGFFLGYVKRVEVSESGISRGCIAFSCLGEEPTTSEDLSLDGHAAVKI